MRRLLQFAGLLALGMNWGCVENSSAPKLAPKPNSVTPDATATEPSGAEPTAAAQATEQASVTKSEPDSKAEGAAMPMPPVWLTPDQVRDGWIQLYDGRTLFGWTSNEESINWHINDEHDIEASTGKPGLLLTHVPFADYEFQCEYWIDKAANSGVFLRTALQPKDPAVDCYELNMWDAAPEFKTASLVKRAKPKKEVTGEQVWKTLHVVVAGNRFQAKFDGEEVLDFTDDTPNLVKTGYIGLQKNAGLVKFRKVALKPLNAKPLFNGQDLAGWHAVAGSKSEFTAVDGTILVKNGQGFLESDRSFGDFALQFEALTNGDGLNSGVFFRLAPSTEKAPSNGYEFQINNATIDGDRSKPKDAGTGAIFRRTTARWVVANDKEWFTATLIAHGPRFCGWVNGLQVTDWEDTRAPDENPRKGLRLAEGPISLQGHDPTTDLCFRNLRIAVQPKAD